MDRPNILLAEDDKDDYNFLVEAFQKVSPAHNILPARNGLECIRFLKTEAKPDIIFLDLNMPIKNGLECLKFIKETERLAEIPVVIYSTSHYIKDIDAAYKGGANFYIVKPSDAGELAERLETVLKRLDESFEQHCKESFVIRNTATLES